LQLICVIHYLYHHIKGDAKTLKESLGKVGSSLVSTEENLVDLVWGNARPPRPCNPANVLPSKYTGKYAL
jgi:Xaa-Pro aminopeptidase